MSYVLSFRIPYTDPFGNRTFYHGACFSKTLKPLGTLVCVQDTKTGLTSPYLGEVHATSSAGRSPEKYRFKIVEGN